MAKKKQNTRYEGTAHEWQIRFIDEAASRIGESRSAFLIDSAVERAKGLIPEAEKRLQELKAEYFNPDG